MADRMATLNDVRHYFGIENATQFRQEWMALSEIERLQIKAGIGNGTYTY